MEPEESENVQFKHLFVDALNPSDVFQNPLVFIFPDQHILAIGVDEKPRVYITPISLSRTSSTSLVFAPNLGSEVIPFPAGTTCTLVVFPPFQDTLLIFNSSVYRSNA